MHFFKRIYVLIVRIVRKEMRQKAPKIKFLLDINRKMHKETNLKISQVFFKFLKSFAIFSNCVNKLQTHGDYMAEWIMPWDERKSER